MGIKCSKETIPMNPTANKVPVLPEQYMNSQMADPVNYCRERSAYAWRPVFCWTASHNDYTDNFVSGKTSNNDYTGRRGI